MADSRCCAGSIGRMAWHRMDSSGLDKRMDTMIERMARVLAGHFASRSWDEMAVDRVEARRLARHGLADINEATQDDCVQAARATLEAMREPTEAMAEAGRFPAEDDGPVACWRTMIDCALTENGK